MTHGISVKINCKGVVQVVISVTHTCGHDQEETLPFTHRGLELLDKSRNQPCRICVWEQINHNRNRVMRNLSQPDAWDN